MKYFWRVFGILQLVCAAALFAGALWSHELEHAMDGLNILVLMFLGAAWVTEERERV